METVTQQYVNAINRGDDFLVPISKLSALGEEAWEPLVSLLSHKDPSVRMEAAVGLAKIDPVKAKEAIASAVSKESDSDVKAIMAQMAEGKNPWLLDLDTAEGVSIVENALTLEELKSFCESIDEPEFSQEVLERAKLFEALPVADVEDKLTDDDPQTRVAAAASLRGKPDAVDLLIKTMKDKDPAVALAAVTSLAHVKDESKREKVQTALADAAKSDSAVIRGVAVWGLSGDKVNSAGEKAILAGLDDKDVNVRWRAAVAAGKTKLKDAAEDLRDNLKHPDGNVRRQSAWALGEIGDKKAGAELVSMAALDKNPLVKTAAREAADKIKKMAETAEWPPVEGVEVNEALVARFLSGMLAQ